jgi:hypothetical protein
MSRQITPSTIASILSIFLVGGLLGLQAYLYTVKAKPAPVEVTTLYPTLGAITAELNPRNERGIFIYATRLRSWGSSPSGSVRYEDSEFGKIDISRPGL